MCVDRPSRRLVPIERLPSVYIFARFSRPILQAKIRWPTPPPFAKLSTVLWIFSFGRRQPSVRPTIPLFGKVRLETPLRSIRAPVEDFGRRRFVVVFPIRGGNSKGVWRVRRRVKVEDSRGSLSIVFLIEFFRRALRDSYEYLIRFISKNKIDEIYLYIFFISFSYLLFKLCNIVFEY